MRATVLRGRLGELIKRVYYIRRSDVILSLVESPTAFNFPSARALHSPGKVPSADRRRQQCDFYVSKKKRLLYVYTIYVYVLFISIRVYKARAVFLFFMPRKRPTVTTIGTETSLEETRGPDGRRVVVR